MRVLFIQNFLHEKNLHALMKYGFDIDTKSQGTDLHSLDLSIYDVVYNPSQPYPTKEYPNIRFIFGPHFSVFPQKYQMDLIRTSNAVYTQPSQWACDTWKNTQNCSMENVTMKVLPFGVDTDKFQPEIPITMRETIFVYHKRRNPPELDRVCNFLKTKGWNFRVFDYVCGYSENEYIQHLTKSKFGVWVGAHESQGFALQEALSCDVPLLVWTVTSLNQEVGSNYEDIPATSISYWDHRCGEYFTHESELETTYDRFISNLENYRPRDFVLENLSIEKCAQKFIQIVNDIPVSESHSIPKLPSTSNNFFSQMMVTGNFTV